MKKSISIAVLTLLVAAVAGAQPAPPRPGKVLAEYLQLTPDQISTWQQIKQETAAVVKPLAANARDLRTQLKTAVTAATPDPAAVGHLALSLHGVQEQIRTAQEAAKSKRIAALTADQQVKFDAFQAAAQFIRQSQRGPAGAR